MSSENFNAVLQNLAGSPLKQRESPGLPLKEQNMPQKWLETIYVMEDMPF